MNHNKNQKMKVKFLAAMEFLELEELINEFLDSDEVERSLNIKTHRDEKGEYLWIGVVVYAPTDEETLERLQEMRALESLD